MTPSPALPQFVPFRSCTTILYTLRLLCISPSRSLSQHNTAAYSEENDGFVAIDRSTNVATPLRPPPSAPFRLQPYDNQAKRGKDRRGETRHYIDLFPLKRRFCCTLMHPPASMRKRSTSLLQRKRNRDEHKEGNEIPK